MGHRKSKKQSQRKRIIFLTIILVVELIALALLVVHATKDKNTASEDVETVEENLPAEQSDQPELEVIPEESEDAGEDAGEGDIVEAVPDRSDYAVQPGRAVGSTEQTEEKVVYLTMDDGPSQNTQAVLDIFDQYNVKATFFVTGAMPEYANMIKVAYDKGHTIGLHTYTHDYAKVYASVDAYFQDLDQVGQLVAEQIGYVPCFIRFPGGSSNSVSKKYTAGIMSQLTGLVQERGYQYYDWNASSGDGAVRTTEELIAQATSFDSNNIILLSHDSAAKQTTVEALPAIIEHYQSKGYVFKALDLNSYVAHHGVNN